MRMSANGTQIVQIRDLSKFYVEGERTRAVLDAVDLDIQEGEFLVLLGKSGSGKSTLLNLLSGIDITHLDEHRLTLFRRQHLGIIFQFFNLIPTLTVLENVTLPLELSGQSG